LPIPDAAPEGVSSQIDDTALIDVELNGSLGVSFTLRLQGQIGEICGGAMAMFKRADGDDGRALSSPPKIGEALPIRSKNVSVIGPTLIFKGELSADEDLVIEGDIEGAIAHHKKHLTIGKQGRVKADIHASSVIVEGRLVGDIHSEGIVSLAKGADVTGNIYCDRIVMEDGARFKGKIDMGEKPKVSIPKEPVPIDSIKTEKFSA
jgi:cytoskeletal protein CcmA (bactofilin family)